jgi:exodeoxyribonuclease VII large subunit
MFPGMAGPVGEEEAPKIFSITQYNKSVELKMREFPRVWVKGVITQLNVRGRICYVSIGEFEEGDARPRAVLDTTLWTSQLEMFNLRLAALPTPLTLRVELKVAFLLESNFYVPTGRFQPRIVEVDEKFTLGELALTRQKILERLMKEGLLRKNKERNLPTPVLKVGLITAPDSAAYRDFTTTLLGSGFSFRITVASARMQGENTESTVVHALELLSQLPLDVICIVRGGGSKTDLVYFDSEAICRAIANCPVPVLTGIGHEIDNSLADLVAWADKITPTDCAKFLEGLAQAELGGLAERAETLAGAWRMEFQQAWHDLGQKAGDIRREWDGRRVAEVSRGREQARLLGAAARRNLIEGRKVLRMDAVGLSRGPGKLLRLERLRFVNRSQAIGHAWARWREARSRDLVQGWERLRERVRRLIGSQMEKQAAMPKALRAAWERDYRRSGEALGLKGRLIHAADPARVLDLGFSILRGADGKVIRSVGDVEPGQRIVNELRDGRLESRVVEGKEQG